MVCHFSNPMVRSQLPLDNRKLYNFARKLLNMSPKKTGYGDLAAWDTFLIESLSKREDIELHVISAHSGLKKSRVCFVEKDVHYYFVKCDYATLLKRLIKSPSLWFKLNPMRPIVRRLIRRIKPSIVVLMGAENAYISSTVMGITDIPVIIQCQTIYNNPERVNYGSVDEKNAFIERELFREAKYVAVPTRMHYDLFKQLDSNAKVFGWKALIPFPVVNPIETKRYDFVTFAVNMCEKKGFFDAIKALAIVKSVFPNVTLNLIGGGSEKVKQELRDLCLKLGVVNNVMFTPFFEKQEDLFQHIQYSRFALLPSKLDYVSGTMIQAMYYGLPLICYQTEGTPSFNKTNECALIAEMNNVNELAEKMILLLKYPNIASQLKKNAKDRLEKQDNTRETIEKLVNTYKAIVEYENNGVIIPDELYYKPL